MDLIGKSLGNYEIVTEIGTGGMATVYRGNQPSLSRQVAVKVLSSELARDTLFRERFAREARAIAQLAHPNILPVYDFGQDHETGALYFVMQLIEGGALAQRMGQPMQVEAAVRITAQIARALDYAHKRGLVHRDVKPANVLLTPDGHPLLSDFGIARMMQETHLTQTGVSLGTPAYMSPEQAKGGVVDQRTDLYALGVVAYEMLAGKLPFEADTPVGMLHQHAYVAPPPLRTLRPDLARSVEKVVMRALSKDPAQRYASAGEFADALEQAMAGKWRLPLPPILRRTAAAQPPELELPEPARAPTAVAVAAPSPPATPPLPAARPLSAGARVGGFFLGFGQWLLKTLLTIVVITLIVILVLLVVGTVVVGMLTEQTIARQNWHLDTVVLGRTYFYSRSDFENGLQLASEPYALGALTNVRVRFEPPETIVFSARLRGNAISLQIRARAVEDIPNVQIERLNDFPLYVIGGLLSDRVNSGFRQAWKDAPILIDTMTMTEERITAIYRRR